jgi:hypothetical protein
MSFQKSETLKPEKFDQPDPIDRTGEHMKGNCLPHSRTYSEQAFTITHDRLADQNLINISLAEAETKKEMREQLAKDIQTYLEAGGSITYLEPSFPEFYYEQRPVYIYTSTNLRSSSDA